MGSIPRAASANGNSCFLQMGSSVPLNKTRIHIYIYIYTYFQAGVKLAWNTSTCSTFLKHQTNSVHGVSM